MEVNDEGILSTPFNFKLRLNEILKKMEIDFPLSSPFHFTKILI